MRILTINSGSSSIKFSIYECKKASEASLAFGSIINIGLRKSEFAAKSGQGFFHKEYDSLPDHRSAIEVLIDWLNESSFGKSLDGIGHRVVHGGEKFISPSLVTDKLMDELRGLSPLAPNHLPHEILAIDAFRRLMPAIGQVACFDTAFHRDMPQEAQTYPLPENLRKEGIIRYGFHGLSYEYIMSALAYDVSSRKHLKRVIVAHLGHGASMAAVKNGRCMDTSMGFTPSGGLVMSTRTGDLDPGILIHLLTQKGMTPDDINTLVYKRSGLLGLSGSSSDMKELLAKAKTDPQAQMAISIFCYQARKFIGAYCSVLGGLDTLVFTGGIGENAPYVRDIICQGLDYLGIRIDKALNNENAAVISNPSSGVAVRVIKTNEELMVARHTYRALLCREP